MIPGSIRSAGPRGTGLVLLAIFTLALFVRFYRLRALGVDGCDHFLYSEMARRWAEGSPVNAYAKPFYHLLGAGAVALFGYTDYAVHYLNCLTDLANVLLVFAIGIRLGLHPWFALAAAALSAADSVALSAALSGLPHVSSATFALLSFYGLLGYREAVSIGAGRGPAPLAALAASGAAAGAAGNIHPTLLCFPIAGFLILIFAGRENRVKAGRILVHALVFSFGFLLFFALLGLVMAAGKMSSVPESVRMMMISILLHHEDATGGYRSGFWGQLSRIISALAGLGSRPVVFLLALSVTVSIAAWIRLPVGSHTPPATPSNRTGLSMLLTFPVVFILLLAAVARSFEERLLMPIAPFLLLGALQIGDMCSRGARRRDRIAGAVFLASVFAGGASLASAPDLIWKSRPSVYRQVVDEVGRSGEPAAALAVGPDKFYEDGMFFSAYIPQNRLFHIKTLERPMTDRRPFEALGIRYVLSARTQIDFRPQEYDTAHIEGQYALLHESMERLNARAIPLADGTLYELSPLAGGSGTHDTIPPESPLEPITSLFRRPMRTD